MDRVNWLCKIGRVAIKAYYGLRYNISYEGKLPQPPLVILPKHQSMHDLPLEAIYIYERSGKLANFIMRPLPCNFFFEALGGITIARAKEIRKGTYDKEEGKNLNQRATEQAIGTMKLGEPLVIHPEGTRSSGSMGNIRIKQDSVLDTILKEQRNYQAIAFVPLGIEYVKKDIHIRAGEPFFTDDSRALEERLAKELPKLSGL